MLEALDDSQRAQRQLVADASHELRTPLTSLRTNIEVLAEVDALPPEDRERLLARRGRAARRADRARHRPRRPRARGRARRRSPRTCGSTCWSTEAVERARRHARDKRFATDLEPCLVVGVPGRLDRAVSNLLDNAAKWSPPGGEIEVARARRRGDRARPRAGHRRGRPAVRVRPLLPRAGRARPAGVGARPRDRAPGRGVARRRGRRRARRRRRRDDAAAHACRAVAGLGAARRSARASRSRPPAPDAGRRDRRHAHDRRAAKAAGRLRGAPRGMRADRARRRRHDRGGARGDRGDRAAGRGGARATWTRSELRDAAAAASG